MKSTRHHAPDLWICLALLAATLAVYSPVRNFDFINYDDPGDVSGNPHVHRGMSMQSVAWAFSSTEGSKWLPLVRLSYILQYRHTRLEAGSYHIVNLLLHALASVLLYIFLLRATNVRWPSAFVAFLFALHPLHVESVAWVAQRKDVFCAVFWFLTLWAWVRYTERPDPWRYFVALLLFCLGLMSGPMIVALPFILLLLDCWPLERPWNRQLLLEKLPFFALSAGSAAIAYLAMRSGRPEPSLSRFPFSLENALITWIVCIAKVFWPTGLAVVYPYPKQLPAWQAAASVLALACISALVLRWLRTRPWLAVGWFWYLGTLVPLIGWVQTGVQARVDHAMYVPVVGLGIMMAWGAADFVHCRSHSGRWVAVLAIAALAALVPATWNQEQHWKNSETLFRHTIDVTGRNPVARLNLGGALASVPGRLPEAISVLEAGLRTDPDDEQLQAKLGATLLMTNAPVNVSAAVDHLRAGLRIDPNDGEAYASLAAASLRLGRTDEAVEEGRAAVRLRPDYSPAHYYLASALFRQGKVDESIDQANAALRVDPDSAEAHNIMGCLLWQTPGQFDEAIRQFREAVGINPDFVEAHVNLGAALTRKPGDTFEVLSEFEEALRVDPDCRPAHVALGIILSTVPRRRAEAITHLQAALRIQPDPRLQKRLDELQSPPRRRVRH
jgi:protein O-mannosyl-transferase